MIGDYIRNTWINGPGVGHPPINEDNLNNIESKLDEIDNFLESMANNYRFKNLKEYFWNRNCKQIEQFDVKDDWTAIAGTTLNVNSENRTGNADITFRDSDDIAGTIGLYRTITSIDLTKFNDETSSSSDDIIDLCIEIHSHAFFDDITLKLGTDSGNYYYYTWAVDEDWRVNFHAKKGDFNTVGAPAGWDDITYVRVECTTTAGSSTHYNVLLLLMMYRNDVDNDGYPNPFQIYNGNTWENYLVQNATSWMLYFDFAVNDLGMIRFNDYNDPDNKTSIKIFDSIYDFCFQSLHYHKNDGAGGHNNSVSIIWYVDSDNYIELCLNGSNLLLYAVEAGAATPTTIALENDLHTNEMFELVLEKKNSRIIATCKKLLERDKIIEYETSIDASTPGLLYFGNYGSNGLSYVVDYIISNENNYSMDVWDKPRIIMKKSDESISADTTLSNDDQLYAYLPPNSFFEIDFLLKYYTNASTTPDIKVDWLATGDIEAVTQRACFGYAVATATMYSASFKYYAMDLTQEMPYGGGEQADKYSFAKEKFIVKTGVNGGILQLRWAQNTSDANATTVKAGSYIKVTKLDLLQQND
jgi:hypothetical protein